MTADREITTIWPGFMSALEPDASESTVAAALPADIAVEKPSSDLPTSISAWSGEWFGWADQGRRCDVKLIVEQLSRRAATIVCARASADQAPYSERLLAQIHGNELHGRLKSGATLRFRMRNPDAVELLWSEPDGRWIAGVLAQLSAGGRRIVERVPTGILERGEQITLEMVTFKPDGRGPFPTLMFNHGSTGIGNDPSLFTSTVTSPALAKYFNDRGWMVVFPQRRGRGKSGGLYDEGFEPDRSRYSDDPRHALAGFEHALVDVECIAEHLLSRDDVDCERLLIGGHSRGGFLALAFAGARPELFSGVLNFVGGWVDEHGPASEMINPVIARRGATFSGPTTWLYAENDPFYSIAHSHKNYHAFEAAGGQGQFHVLELLPGQDGHHILSLTGLWGPIVDGFLDRVDKRNSSSSTSN
ncbi:dienelactone hydrolase [Variovorax sp. SG517]|uniref:alpha/beta hydrolase family protein n=1 Tax=Variovorax sp. SG517 TaxID=2587117 RepID=UPI00159E1DDC|nr:alpha/beta hydrolase [Variovorax sp. SG517]NVM86433.1 dienelactone hydrolase [Variovorax sp. SG517]